MVLEMALVVFNRGETFRTLHTLKMTVVWDFRRRAWTSMHDEAVRTASSRIAVKGCPQANRSRFPPQLVPVTCFT